MYRQKELKVAKTKAKYPWENKIGNHSQIGGIETSVLDNGPGRGTRIAWVNTGTVLRYKIVIDRALDIVDAFYNEHSLAWLSHSGITAPRPDINSGLEWLYSFGGGLMTTCGLTHAGAPDDSHGLHGRISNIPAQVESIVQPDPANGKLDMSITALVKQSSVFGPNLELRRTISGRIGEPVIAVHDVVTNCGNSPAPHMMLYHCNFGWPLVDEGAEIMWQGSCKSRGSDMDNRIFDGTKKCHKIPAPIENHRGFGEACGFIDAAADKGGNCITGIHNKKIGLTVVIKFRKKQLPCLANWQHWGPGEYVTGLEPGTNPPIGQTEAKRQKKLIYIKPGRSKSYDLKFAVLNK